MMAQTVQTPSSSPMILTRNSKRLLSQKNKVDPDKVSIVNTGLSIANYYIPYHLRSNCEHESLRGLPKHFVIPPAQTPETYIHVANLCSRMEKSSAAFFEGLPQHMKLRHDNAKLVFMNVSNKVLCNDGINWGRVVSIYTLGGAFAVHFVNKGQLDIVKKIPGWIEEVIEKHLTGWILEQGGWESIKKSCGNDNGANLSWSSYVTVGVVAAAGFFLLGGLRK